MQMSQNDQPPPKPPRWMRQNEAASYLRVSTVTFRHRVRAGRLPGPYTGSGHLLWSRDELDKAVRGADLEEPAPAIEPPEHAPEDPIDAVRRALAADAPPKKRRKLPPFQ